MGSWKSFSDQNLLYKAPIYLVYSVEIIIFFFIFIVGDAYFFKDNLYWVLKKGGMDEDNVTPKSIAVDWLRCPAPTTTRTPANPNPKDCSCNLIRSSSVISSASCLLLFLSLIWPTWELAGE